MAPQRQQMAIVSLQMSALLPHAARCVLQQQSAVFADKRIPCCTHLRPLPGINCAADRALGSSCSTRNSICQAQFPWPAHEASHPMQGFLDRDFAGSRPGTSGAQRSWLTGPQAGGGGRGPAADGAWTSRLAEAPSEISTAHLPSALISTPSPRSSVGTVHDGDSQATGASSVSPRAVEGASPTVARGLSHSGTLAGDSNGWGHTGTSDSHLGQETASAGTSMAPRMADALQQVSHFAQRAASAADPRLKGRGVV